MSPRVVGHVERYLLHAIAPIIDFLLRLVLTRQSAMRLPPGTWSIAWWSSFARTIISSTRA